MTYIYIYTYVMTHLPLAILCHSSEPNFLSEVVATIAFVVSASSDLLKSDLN